MGTLKENPRGRGLGGAPIIDWAFRHFSGKSIFRTPRVNVSVKRINAHQTNYVVSGRIETSAHETSESILRRIVQTLVPARNEKSDWPISHDGKEPVMGAAISYDADNLPTLNDDDLAHLTEIKRRAAIRRAQRIAVAGQDSVKAQSSARGRRAIVPIQSSRGKLVKISK